MQCLQDKIGEGDGLEAQAIVSRDGLYVIDPTDCFSVASHLKREDTFGYLDFN